MKEDACGSCRTGGKIDDYKAMQSAIDATGSKLILTIEGQPPFPAVADGLHGNARRVGHDISPEWLSMTSLVDIGSGLWSFAHNDTGSGGWWNDLVRTRCSVDFKKHRARSWALHLLKSKLHCSRH